MRFLFSMALFVLALPTQAMDLDTAVAKFADWDASSVEIAEATNTLRVAGANAQPQLRALLKSNVWRARRDVLELILPLNLPDAADLFNTALGDDNWAVRERAAVISSTVSSDLTVKIAPQLAKLRADAIGRVRLAAYKTLDTWQPNTLLPEALNDSDTDVSSWAALTMIQRGKVAALPPHERMRVIDSLISGFKASGWTNIDRAIFSLGPAAGESIYEALLAAPAEYRRNAVSTLGNVGGADSIDLMFRFINDPDYSVRANALNIVAAYCTEKHMPRLIAIADSTEDQSYRGYVISAVARLKYKLALPWLLRLCGHQDTNIRRAAIGAVAALGDKTLIPQLLDIYRREPYAWMRSQMIQPLAQLMGEDGAEFVRSAINDPNEMVRGQAIYASRVLKKEEREKLYCNILKDETREETVYAVLNSLGDLQSEAVADALVATLESGNKNIKRAVVYALGNQRSKKTVPAIIDIYQKETDIEVRQAILSIPMQLVDDRFVPMLMRVLEGDDQSLQVNALNTLISRYPQTIDDRIITRIMGKEKDPNLVIQCLSILSRRPKLEPGLLPALTPLARDENQAIRTTAIVCLSRVQSNEQFGLLCDVMKNDADASARNVAAVYVVSRIKSGAISVEQSAIQIGVALQAVDEPLRLQVVSTLAATHDKAAAPILLDVMLHDVSENVRRAAATGLRDTATPGMVPQLLQSAGNESRPESLVMMIELINSLDRSQGAVFAQQQLKSSDSRVQAEALRVLGQSKNPALVPFYVERYLKSSSQEIRLISLRNVCQSRDRRIIKIILPAMRDPDPQISDTALKAAITFADAEVCNAIIDRISKPSETTVAIDDIADAIARGRGRDTAQRLLDAGSRAEDPVLLERILVVLARVGDKRAIPFAAELAMSSQNEKIRIAAINALSALEAIDQAQACLNICGQTFSDVSDAALAAAWKLGKRSEAEEIAKPRFNAGKGSLRAFYAQFLSQAARNEALQTALNEKDSRAIAALLLATENPDATLVDGIAASGLSTDAVISAIQHTKSEPVLRGLLNGPADVAAAALERMAQLAPEAVGGVVDSFINSPEHELQVTALRTARATGQCSQLSQVIKLSQGNDAVLRLEAIRTLGRLSGDGVKAAMLAVLEKSSDPIELEAAALGARDASAVPRLVLLSETAEPAVRVAALKALADINTPAAKEAIGRAFAQENVDCVRVAAVRFLATNGGDGNTHAIAGAMRSSLSFEVQSACAESLGVTTGPDVEKYLLAALDSDSGLVRASSATALGNLKCTGAMPALERLVSDYDIRAAASARAALEAINR